MLDFLKIGETDKNCSREERREHESPLLNPKMPNFGRGLFSGGCFLRKFRADPQGSGGFLRQEGDQAVGGEGQQTEKEVAGDFGSPAHPHESTAPVVFEVGINSLDRRAFLEAGFFMGCEAAGVGAAARIGVDDGNMPLSSRKILDLRCVVGRIHEIVEDVGKQGVGALDNRDGGLGVVERGAGEKAADGNVEIGGGEVEFESFPGFLVALAVAFGAFGAVGGEVGNVLFQSAMNLEVEAFVRSGRADFAFFGAAAAFGGCGGIGGLGCFHDGFSAVDGCGVDADMADEAVAEMGFDELAVSELRELLFGKLFEGAGKSAAVGNVADRIPTTEPAQGRGGVKAVDELFGGVEVPNHFCEEGFCQRQAAEWFASVAFPLKGSHEGVELAEFDQADELGFLGGEEAEFGFEGREEVLLEAV